MTRETLLTLLIGVGSLGLGWIARQIIPRAVTRYIDNKVDQRFKLALVERQAELSAEQAVRQDLYTKELERLKSELQRDADVIRHKQQRELTDFGLFTTKRHEVYASTYTKLRRIVELRATAEWNRSKTPDYGSMDASGLALQLSRLDLDDEWTARIMQISSTWPLTKRGELAYVAVREALLETLGSAVRDALGYVSSNALYYSPAVAGDLDAFAAEFRVPLSDHQGEASWYTALLLGVKLRMQYDISGGLIQPESSTPVVQS